MKREVEISILKALMRQIDGKQNVDAGVMYRSPTDVYARALNSAALRPPY